jgi:hypothetical protein
MLIYHQRNDIFHCAFRLLSILSLTDKNNIELARLKIIDFYIVFPHLVGNIAYSSNNRCDKNKETSTTL